MRNLFYVVLTLIALLGSQAQVFAQGEKEYFLQGKNEGNVSYMGMVSINGSPFPYGFHVGDVLFGSWSLGLQTSHGVYFAKQRLYAGLSVELLALPPGILINPHVRYYFAGHKSKIGGYVGADGGMAIVGEDLGYSFGVEAGLVVNFKKTALDIGLRAQCAGVKNVLLPLKIGIVF